MSFSLQQVTIPVESLGPQDDPPDLTAWLDFFAARIVTMRAAHPCKARVRIAQDVAERMYGADMPWIDPSSETTVLTECGADRQGMTVLFDRNLASNTVRLE